MDPRRSLLAVTLAGIGTGVITFGWAAPVRAQARGGQQQQSTDGSRGQSGSSAAPRPSTAPPTPPPTPSPAPPSTPRLGTSIPQDSRVALPSDTRAGRGFDPRPAPARPPALIDPRPADPASLGAVRVPLPERPGERGRDRDRDRDRVRDPEQPESAIEHARRLDREARERYGLPQPGFGDGHRPHRAWPRPYYQPYWVYEPYWGDGYRPPYQEGWQDNWGNGQGGGGLLQDNGADARDPRGLPPINDGRGAAGGDARGTGLGEATVPFLPPDEVLGDGDLSPALRKALDGSPEWRQATAALIRAWSEYAQAANRVLADVRRTSDYRRAIADYKRAQARVDVLQGVGAGAAPVAQPALGGNRAGDPLADRLVPAADEAIRARRVVQSMERDALGRDAQVRSAQRRVDDAIERRDKVRDAVAAKLPEAERAPKRPKLLDDE
jgi:hypothetical protein